MKKLASLLLALVMVLGMCAAASAEEPITITFWHTYGDAETPILDEVVIPMFEAANPGIKVEAIRQSGDFNQMLVTAFGTGVVPDVARVDITKTSAYANLGGIIAMDELEGFAALKDAVLEGPLSTNLWNGHYYGLPLNTNCKAAVLNMNVLKTLGFDAAPATMEEFIAACMEKAPGEYKLNVSGLGDWDMLPYFWLFGGILTDEGFTKASGYMDSEQSVAAIEAIMQMHDDGVFTIRDLDGSPDAWDGINSQYAMFFEGPWAPFNEENGIVPALIPTYNGQSASVVGGENIVIFSGSEKQEAAFKFVEFMLSEEAQLELLKVGVIPTLKACVDSEAVQNDPKWSVYMEQLASAKSRIPTPQASTVEQLWTDAMTEIFMEGADVQEVLTAYAAEIDIELAK
ncbi:MAG: extracellular solute-binding protein [Oscillospiraceae bacterium]|nr:extracellular solute-binding protein [Oscillospiraceae bacterium]